MNVPLILVCSAGVIFTIITLIETIRDFRAVSRLRSERNLRDVAAHAVFLESVRVSKAVALTIGVYLAMQSDRVTDGVVIARNWIMCGVSVGIGINSLADLAFRHRMMKRIRIEFDATQRQQKH